MTDLAICPKLALGLSGNVGFNRQLALPYCRVAFLNFYLFVYSLFYLLVRYLGNPKEFRLTMLLKDPLTPGGLGGMVQAPITSLDEELWGMRERVRPELIAEFGELDEPRFE